MHKRLLAGPITAAVLGIVTSVILAATKPSAELAWVVIMGAMLIVVPIVVWSVESDAARSDKTRPRH